ncbi:MAG: hypothetical protein GEV07_29920 [Streptosporangiales bacterium]|nr:hypothetical protein [Streptosporangiales bacterium]
MTALDQQVAAGRGREALDNEHAGHLKAALDSPNARQHLAAALIQQANNERTARTRSPAAFRDSPLSTIENPSHALGVIQRLHATSEQVVAVRAAQPQQARDGRMNQQTRPTERGKFPQPPSFRPRRHCRRGRCLTGPTRPRKGPPAGYAATAAGELVRSYGPAAAA